MKRIFYFTICIFAISSCVKMVEFQADPGLTLEFISPSEDTTIYLNQKFRGVNLTTYHNDPEGLAAFAYVKLYYNNVIYDSLDFTPRFYDLLYYDQITGTNSIKANAFDDFGYEVEKEVIITVLDDYNPQPFAELVNITENEVITSSKILEIKINRDIIFPDRLILCFTNEITGNLFLPVEYGSSIGGEKLNKDEIFTINAFYGQYYDDGDHYIYLILSQNNFMEYTVPIKVRWDSKH